MFIGLVMQLKSTSIALSVISSDFGCFDSPSYLFKMFASDQTFSDLYISAQMDYFCILIFLLSQSQQCYVLCEVYCCSILLLDG